MTNAKKHINKKYLLNLDLKDFFHSVTREMVIQIFAESPFYFKRDLPEMPADLQTYNHRLLMGTPTSPVLSNLACRGLDEELIKLSEGMLWSYTRYADDMSFSSNQSIFAEKINSARAIFLLMKSYQAQYCADQKKKGMWI